MSWGPRSAKARWHPHSQGKIPKALFQVDLVVARQSFYLEVHDTTLAKQSGVLLRPRLWIMPTLNLGGFPRLLAYTTLPT